MNLEEQRIYTNLPNWVNRRVIVIIAKEIIKIKELVKNESILFVGIVRVLAMSGYWYRPFNFHLATSCNMLHLTKQIISSPHHHTDNKLNIDYFSLFTFHKIINI